jgi:hypothetical protein
MTTMLFLLDLQIAQQDLLDLWRDLWFLRHDWLPSEEAPRPVHRDAAQTTRRAPRIDDPVRVVKPSW